MYPDHPGHVAGSETSEAAAESVVRAAPTMRERVLTVLQCVGPGGLTCDEVEGWLANSRHQSVSARFRELSLEGRIYDTGFTRATRSGRQATVYAASCFRPPAAPPAAPLYIPTVEADMPAAPAREAPRARPEPFQPTPAYANDNPALVILSDQDNRFTFGVTADNHAASKYERLDVLEDLYDRFYCAGAQEVFHAGNWIDGEAKFNRQDITAIGLEGQCRHLARVYPRRPGMQTYAIWGDDHEGWYTREGINVGRYAEDVMRQAGRHDWHDLGFMEAHVKLVNRNTGASAIMAIVHPGGGSAYATSYRPQKIVEAMEGGEKPAVLVLGHYHKLDMGNHRNVWTIQAGCTQDQTVFMRKKSLAAHVGGVLAQLEQDPDTGAIIECNGMRRYFNRAYYTQAGHGNNRWSKHGPVDAMPRSLGGV